MKRGKIVQVPTVLQMEALECGAASLAMVLAYYGKYVPLEELRITCGVSRDGSKASSIMKAARKYGLEGAGYKKEPGDLRNISFPAIIHWNFNHFVVLEGFKKDKAYINDPASGRRAISEQELDMAFTGIVLVLKPSVDFKKGGQKANVIKDINIRLFSSKKHLIYLILVGLALVFPGLVIPVFSKVFVDEVLLGGKVDWLFAIIIGMGLTAIVRVLLTWLRHYYLLKLQTKVSIVESGKFLWHVLRLPVEFFSQRYAGDISTRMQNNDKVASFLSGELANTALNVFVLVFYLLLMFQYNALLSFIGVIAAFINILYLIYASRNRAVINQKLTQETSRLMSTTIAGLQIIETLKATASESDFFARWGGYHAKTLSTQQQIGQENQLLSAMPAFMTSLTDIMVLTIGGIEIINGKLTIGSLVAFQFLMSSFMQPISELMAMGLRLQEIKTDMSCLDDVLRYPLDKHVVLGDANESVFQSKLEGFIEVKGLAFGYSPLEAPLITDFSLELRPGERVALVGGSGSGKSTVAKLISGIYQPWSGEIFFDGKKRSEFPRYVLNNSLSVVDQDICMFNDPISDNITLWDQCVPELDIIRAAKDACIHDDITARPGSYEHMMTEGGTNFSGGQRQRIEIARALVSNPSVLILDEATSALDPKTEKQVFDNIRRRGCTCIIVAHRLSTIRDCDEIIVLDKGKIVQRGTHNQLKNVEGHYSNLINIG